jgi:hypothetical protein
MLAFRLQPVTGLAHLSTDRVYDHFFEQYLAAYTPGHE